MGRRLFTLAAATSAFLCALACALWLRSYSAAGAEQFVWGRYVAVGDARPDGGRDVALRREALLTFHRGQAEFEWYWQTDDAVAVTDPLTPDPQPGGWFAHARTPRADRPRGRGFYYLAGPDSWPFAWVARGVPMWFPVALAGVLPGLAAGLWWRHHRRGRRRAARGLCGRCGYDLRATPDKGGGLLCRCPECGATGMTMPATAAEVGSPTR